MYTTQFLLQPVRVSVKLTTYDLQLLLDAIELQTEQRISDLPASSQQIINLYMLTTIHSHLHRRLLTWCINGKKEGSVNLHLPQLVALHYLLINDYDNLELRNVIGIIDRQVKNFSTLVRLSR